MTFLQVCLSAAAVTSRMFVLECHTPGVESVLRQINVYVHGARPTQRTSSAAVMLVVLAVVCNVSPLARSTSNREKRKKDFAKSIVGP